MSVLEDDEVREYVYFCGREFVVRWAGRNSTNKVSTLLSGYSNLFPKEIQREKGSRFYPWTSSQESQGLQPRQLQFP